MNEKTWRAKFAEILKEKMIELEFTQAELAKKIGVGQTLVSRWCRAKGSPSSWNLIKLCTILDLDLSDIAPFGMFDWQYAEG